MEKLIAKVKVSIAYLTNNREGKSEDVHGRTYRSMVRRFGFDAMGIEYLGSNSWMVK